jgi:hypothetical protein
MNQNLNTLPSFILDVREIRSIVDNYNSKYDHILIRTKGNSNLHLKSDDPKKDKKLWIDSINFMRQKFKSDSSEITHLSNLDQETKIQILAENDIRFWFKIEKSLNHSTFIYDKKLEDIFDNTSFESLQNRVLLSKVYKTTKRSFNRSIEPSKKDSDLSINSSEIIQENRNRMSSANILGNMINGIKQPSSYYAFLICQKPIVNIHEEFYLIDDEVLDKNILVEPYEYNRIYLFNYKSVGDNSKVKKAIQIERITSLSAQESHQKYKLKISTNDDKKYILEFFTAYECFNWLKGLQKAIQIQEEILRSQSGVIKHNINILYKRYESKQMNDIYQVVDIFYSKLVMKLSPDSFFGELKKTNQELNYFCDAFFSYKPFLSKFFELLIKRIHMQIRRRLCEYWNLQRNNMNPGELLIFGKLANDYLQIMNYWGVSDDKFKTFNHAVMVSFSNQLIESSKEIMFTVINEALFKFKKENGHYTNDANKILEAHMNICFDNMDQLCTGESAKVLAKFISQMISLVQINLIWLVQKEDFNSENEVLCALINNSFESLIRNFIRKIHMKSKSEISLKQIREILNYNYLLRNDDKLNRTCMEKLEERIVLEINDLFLNVRKDFSCLKIEKIFQEFDLLYRDIVLGLENEINKLDICEILIKINLKGYFSKFCLFLDYISQENIKWITLKIRDDHSKFIKYFRPLISTEFDSFINILLSLAEFLSSEDIESIYIHLVNIITFFGKEYATEEYISQFFNAKVYFSEAQRSRLFKNFNTSLDTVRKSVIGIDKVDIAKEAVILYLPKKFIKILKMRTFGDKLEQYKSILQNYKTNTEQLLYNSFLVGDIYKFNASCTMIKFPVSIEDLEIENFIMNYLKRKSMLIDVFVKLKPDALQICLDQGGSNVEAYIKYPFIKCLNKLNEAILYFKSNRFGYCIRFSKKQSHLTQRLYKNLLMLMDQDANQQNLFSLGILYNAQM